MVEGWFRASVRVRGGSRDLATAAQLAYNPTCNWGGQRDQLQDLQHRSTWDLPSREGVIEALLGVSRSVNRSIIAGGGAFFLLVDRGLRPAKKPTPGRSSTSGLGAVGTSF